MAIKLTKTELSVIKILTSTGQCNKLIAEQLGVCEQQVKKHLSHIYKKLNVKNRTELILRRIQND